MFPSLPFSPCIPGGSSKPFSLLFAPFPPLSHLFLCYIYPSFISATHPDGADLSFLPPTPSPPSPPPPSRPFLPFPLLGLAARFAPRQHGIFVALRPHSWPESGVLALGLLQQALCPRSLFALPQFCPDSLPWLRLRVPSVRLAKHCTDALSLLPFLLSSATLSARQHPQGSADHAKPQARWYR